MIQYNYEEIKKGNFKQLEDVKNNVVRNREEKNELLYAIDAACSNDEFLANFEQGFQKEYGANVKFSKLSDDLIKKQYDIQQTNIQPLIATTVIPTMEQLVKSHELLKRINIVNVADKNVSYRLVDFNEEVRASILGEVAAGTDVDESVRQGDVLLANQKVQASMRISEFSFNVLGANEIGVYLARLTRRVQNELCIAILSNGSSVGNNTPRNENIRGILNNYGINAANGDLANFIGAISYATKTATDSAIVANGGTASTDAYDLAVKAKAFLLPTNIIDAEEEDYIFLGNRNSWAAISTVADLNGRYKSRLSIDTATGKAKKTIDETEFVTVPLQQCPNNRVYLFPPKFYTLYMCGNLINLSDDGKMLLKEGLTQLVSRAWVSGSMIYGHKYKSNTTSITIGTTPIDNQEQNAFRVFNLV